MGDAARVRLSSVVDHIDIAFADGVTSWNPSVALLNASTVATGGKAKECDGLSLEGSGPGPLTVTITVHPMADPDCERVRVDASLARPLGLEGSSESRSEVLQRLWEYVTFHSLQNPLEKTSLNLNDELKAIFGVETLALSELGAAAARFFSPVSPSVFTYVLETTEESGPGEVSFDVPVTVPWTGFSAPGSSEIGATGPRHLEILQCHERIGTLTRAVEEATLKRTFLDAFAADPVSTTRRLVDSVVQDSQVARLDPDVTAALNLAAGESLWRQSAPFYESKMAGAVKRYVASARIEAEKLNGKNLGDTLKKITTVEHSAQQQSRRPGIRFHNR